MVNSRISHIEDWMFTEGTKGLKDILFVLTEMQKFFQTGTSGLHITTKWDGSPAIICGTYPDTERFFVSTKSFFNKEPKINYTLADIMNNHPDSFGLQETLKVCLRYLREINIKGILQGDLMFCRYNNKTDLFLENGNVCFQPNVIKYSIPINTNLGQKILGSHVGIVFHTYYSPLMEASYKINIGNLTPSKNVWYRDASLVNSIGTPAFFNENENFICKGELYNIKSLMENIPKGVLNYFSINETLKNLTQQYINDIIRQGRNNHLDWPDYLVYCHQKLTDHVNEAKKPDTIQNRQQKKKELMDWFSKNQLHVCNIFMLYDSIVSNKNLLIDKLNMMKDIDTGNYIPEGYVISSNNLVFKLVDRTKFSFENFQNEGKWKK